MVVELVAELDKLYKQAPPKTKEEADIVLNGFLEKRFRVEILKKCQLLNIEPKNCQPLEKKWNNARFAAFLTYEKNSDEIEKLHRKVAPDLRSYFHYIEKKYSDFNNQDSSKDFSTYLLE